MGTEAAVSLSSPNGLVQVRELSDASGDGELSCDVLIIGGGPAGLTVARGLDGTKLNILIVESGGLEEAEETENLNQVVVDSDTWTDSQTKRRASFHGSLARLWSHQRQGYGVRCRALGGSTAAWAGKSAAFDAIDLETRAWVPDSGWPIKLADLAEPLERAAAMLNLGPNCYDDEFWGLIGRTRPEPAPDPDTLRSFFWQFARSTIDPMDILRSGREFLRDGPTPCRILTRATAVEILLDPAGRRAEGAVVACRKGERHRIAARSVVLAASAIENARLLLVSRRSHPTGIGNAHDNVGRCLLDHVSAEIGRFEHGAIRSMSDMFGFYGLASKSGVHMYTRGLAPLTQVQRTERLLNCAAFISGERAPDDPWSAAKRILRRRSKNYISDGLAILRSPGLVATGLGRIALQSDRIPKAVSKFTVDQIIRFRPNFVAEEFMTRGVPHKLTSLAVHVICEQAPNRENRVTLSDKMDPHGVPLPGVRWRVGEHEGRTFSRFSTLIRESFARSGMPEVMLADWVEPGRFEDAAVIDMAHSAGTTRMSDDPKQGVVDRDCRVHGVEDLYVAGASVFPTIGHANPTLMITALAVRLSDRIMADWTGRVV